MRAGVSTVQQMLTAEAATILRQAVTEASKRGHAQATPLHVAATLLVSPSSPLRRACLQTHPHSSHLPHCRGLELCFNIALDRLQTAQGPLPSGQPSYSNALVAALKRAQAHQRRGCPEQQQQPLLAVKVELEQLIISILDDPSVSRVMREAGFSSTDVKSHLEEVVSLMATHHTVPHMSMTEPVRLPLSANAMDRMGFRLGSAQSILGGFPLPHHLSPFSAGHINLERNDMQRHARPLQPQSSYINPILLKPGGVLPIGGGGEDTKHVLEVLLRKKRRNPIVIGDSAARIDGVLRHVVQLLERRNVPECLHGVKVISADLSFMTLMHASKEDLRVKFLELNKSVQELVLTGGVVVNVGNLQWLLPGSQMAGGFCPVQHVVQEIKDLFAQHQDCSRMWLIGAATSQTFKACLAVHPALESQLELQPVQIGSAASANLPARCSTPDVGVTGADSLTLSLLPSTSRTLQQVNSPGEDDAEPLSCCVECRKTYEEEASLLCGREDQKQPDSPQSCSSSVETPSKAPSDHGAPSTSASQSILPLWLQQALPSGSAVATASIVTSKEVKGKTLPLEAKLQELRTRWNQNCRNVHTERFSRLNASLDRWRQPSPTATKASGHPSGRCQEQAFSLLRGNSTLLGNTKPIVGAYPAVNNHQFARLTVPCLAVSSSLQNGMSDHVLHLSRKDRVQESANDCSASGNGLRWHGPPATPSMRSTEADGSWSAVDNATKPQSSRMLLRMNPEALVQLCKGLAKQVAWQPRIISTIASTVMQCRSHLGRRAGTSLKGDTWLLFLGYDKPGKRRMAEALAELIFGEGKKPICLTFGKQHDTSSPATWSLSLTMPSRGKMPLDQLADAVRNNPSSLFYLEDVEQSDPMFRSSLMQAMSKGRLVDSSGRDFSFSSAIIVMTSSLGTEYTNAECMGAGTEFGKELMMESTAACHVGTPHSGNKESACNATNDQQEAAHEQRLACKRKGVWNVVGEAQGMVSSSLNKKPTLDLDLNLAVEEGSFLVSHETPRNSCDVNGTVRSELGEEEVIVGARKQLGELCDLVDATVVFAIPP